MSEEETKCKGLTRAADSEREGILVHEKCTRQHVPNAARNAKFHSSRKKADLSFAKTATARRRNSDWV